MTYVVTIERTARKALDRLERSPRRRTVDDGVRLVNVTNVGHRRSIYREV